MCVFLTMACLFVLRCVFVYFLFVVFSFVVSTIAVDCPERLNSKLTFCVEWEVIFKLTRSFNANTVAIFHLLTGRQCPRTSKTRIRCIYKLSFSGFDLGNTKC